MVGEEFPFGVRVRQERYGILVLVLVEQSLLSVRKQITVIMCLERHVIFHVYALL